jgi:hypothetical protein
MLDNKSKWYEDEPFQSLNFNYKSKNKKIQIVFDPFIISVVILLFVISISLVIIYLVKLNLYHEIQFYHQIISQHNETITKIENKILGYSLQIDQIISSNNTEIINKIIAQIDKITSELNVTQLQNNIQEITKVIMHYAPPSSYQIT